MIVIIKHTINITPRLSAIVCASSEVGMVLLAIGSTSKTYTDWYYSLHTNYLLVLLVII